MANILIVDDSIVMRKNLATILKQAGHTIIGEASNGRQAITQYFELQPDLVTMDISMPIMSGVEAVRQIIAKDTSANIIMISAVNQKKMVFSAINYGAKHYIVKPIDPKKVMIFVEGIPNSEEMSVLSAPLVESDIQGFQIDNEMGQFIIRFNENLGTKDHSLLTMALNGILFIKPLKVRFDFGQLTDISELILNPILKLASDIKNNGAEVSFNAESTAIQVKIDSQIS